MENNNLNLLNKSNYDINTKINDLIIEHFKIKGLNKSLNNYMKESNLINSKNNWKELIFNDFNNGNRKLFFEKWHKLNHNKKNISIEKLEFYLNIYFYIYFVNPLFKNLKKIPEEEVNNFKDFLENKGSDLSKTSEFLPYYALPYIKNINNHQAFKHIFTKEFVKDIKSKLDSYLNNLFNNDKEKSKLESIIYDKINNSNNKNSSEFKINNNSEIEKLKNKIEEYENYMQEEEINKNLKIKENKKTFKDVNIKWFNFSKYNNKKNFRRS